MKQRCLLTFDNAIKDSNSTVSALLNEGFAIYDVSGRLCQVSSIAVRVLLRNRAAHVDQLRNIQAPVLPSSVTELDLQRI